MSGAFFISLLNPSLCLLFAAAFWVIWRQRQGQPYLCIVALGFAFAGGAFIAQDLLLPSSEAFARIVTNGLFLAAVTAACCGAILRVHARLPAAMFVTMLALGGAGFCWLIFTNAPIAERVYVMNSTFAALTSVTLFILLKARPRTAADWLIVTATVFGICLAILRPVLTLLEGLELNAGGDFRESSYWATVQAFTPILSVATALAFLVSAALELVGESRSEARTDYMTGLLNRRGFEYEASAALERAGEASWPPALLLADIDDFKKINDTFGHKVGDQVIKRVGHIFSAHGQADIACRIGGEEFALFYPSIRRTDLQATANAFLVAVTRNHIPGLPKDYPVTLSIGLYPRHQEEPLMDMLAGADRALYDAKRGGKNRAVMAPLSLRSVLKQPASMSA